MEQTLAAAFRAALARLDDLPDDFDASAVEVPFETPRDPSHGDLATNVAMQLARPLRRAPRAIAEALVAALDVDPAEVAAVEIAGPGFINVRFASDHLQGGLAEILAAGADWGRTDAHAGERAVVEFVSANPTGPLTVGHGRNAVLGDTAATLLEWTGYAVTREYYYNDAGRQMRVLAESVRARYTARVRPDTPTRELEDGTVVPEGFPDDGYRGGYIEDIAGALVETHGDALLDLPQDSEPASLVPFLDAATAAIFADIEASLAKLGVRMDSQFNERTLYETNAVWDVVDGLRERGLVYERDGATWFKTSELGKTKTDADGEHGVDTVLVKSSGEPTYRLPDIAYHLGKLERGYDLALDVFGADHIATYPDVLRGVEALGGDPSKIEVLVYQFVTLVRGGELVKMSTRKATYETLDDLIDEVGADVVRFFFLMRAPGTHLEFDLDLAAEASDKNPVFYLQYAHARIASIERKATEPGLDGTPAALSLDAAPDLSRLTHASEEALVKTLLAFPDEVRMSAEARSAHRLAGYLREIATAFNAFYRDCRIVGEPAGIATARLHLAHATRQTLANGLTILGIGAPERM